MAIFLNFNSRLLVVKHCVQRTLFMKAIEDMATRSLRCVAIAYRTCEASSIPDNDEELAHWELPQSDLVLLAIVGLKVLQIILI